MDGSDESTRSRGEGSQPSQTTVDRNDHCPQINSGPMSEGHICLYNKPSNRFGDSSQNICLFTSCLFVVGISFLAIGVNLYLFISQLAVVASVLIVVGVISLGSATLYSVLYFAMVIVRLHRNSPNASQKLNEPFSGLANPSDAILEENFPDSRYPKDAINSSNFDQNSSSSREPNSLELNVDNLNYNLESLLNLEPEVWTTVSGELPRKYLNSFGDLPKLPSPNCNMSDNKKQMNACKQFDKQSSRESFLFKNRHHFSNRMKTKSDSQTELLECGDVEQDNTLFNVDSIYAETCSVSDPSNCCRDGLEQPDSDSGNGESVTLMSGAPFAESNELVVHFNKSHQTNDQAA